MDRETRGLIENQVDEMIRTLDINDITSWIVEEHLITSDKDLALGYVLGSLVRYAHTVMVFHKSRDKSKKRIIITKKDITEIREILKRRIIDITDIIERQSNR